MITSLPSRFEDSRVEVGLRCESWSANRNDQSSTHICQCCNSQCAATGVALGSSCYGMGIFVKENDRHISQLLSSSGAFVKRRGGPRPRRSSPRTMADCLISSKPSRIRVCRWFSPDPASPRPLSYINPLSHPSILSLELPCSPLSAF